MPQVQVALRALAQGKSVRVNDVISYIMTTTANKDEDKPATTNHHESSAKRAYAPADVLAASSNLKPDVEWYLYKQIFPPIERLCAPMPGTDPMHLAECLGLDTRKYSIGSSTGSSRDINGLSDLSPLETQIPPSIRFKDCVRLTLRCRSCRHLFPFEGLSANIGHVTPRGIVCPDASCGAMLSTISIVAQLERAIRTETSRYYDAWLVCDDSSCGNRTRQMSVYGHRCLGPRGCAEGCRGRMRLEYGERALYNQLLYWRSVWDVDNNNMSGATAAAAAITTDENAAEEREKVKAAAEWNRVRFGTCQGVVDAYLKKCGRVWVQMETIFGFTVGK